MNEDDEPLPGTFHPREDVNEYPVQDNAPPSRWEGLTSVVKRYRRNLRRSRQAMIVGEAAEKSAVSKEDASPTGIFSKLKRKDYIRTLQRFRGNPNEERTEFMEKHSALKAKGLAVSVEQVSIFLCTDNTVISFFEHSANDVEEPILRRLNTADTILKKSADGSLVMQAIIDAIIDLTIPVVTAYEDAIGDLELDVLTDPDIERSKSL